jgi:hypothetical protein
MVIARYKEDLEWLSNYKDMPFRRIIIYNKGPAMAPIPGCKIVTLPNVGFCDQTYLYHIIHEYGNLADITIFLPGSADLPNKILRTYEIINRAFKNEPMIYGRRVNGLYESMADFAIDSSTLSDQDNQDIGKSYILHPAQYRPYGKWLNHYLPSQLACPYVSYKGMFSFSKDMIKKHKSDFYKPFLNQVSHHRFPEASHYMERTWAALVYPFSDSFFHRIPEKEISGF